MAHRKRSVHMREPFWTDRACRCVRVACSPAHMCAQFADAIVVTSDATGERRWLTPVETLDGGERVIVLDKTDSTLNKFVTGRFDGLKSTTYLSSIARRAQDETLRRAVDIHSGGLYDTADVGNPYKRLKATAVAKQVDADGRLPPIVDVELPDRTFEDGKVVHGVTVRVLSTIARQGQGTGACGKVSMIADPDAVGHVIDVLAHCEEQQAAPKRTRAATGPRHVWWCEKKCAVVSQNVHSGKYRTFRLGGDKELTIEAAVEWATQAPPATDADETSDPS